MDSSNQTKEKRLSIGNEGCTDNIFNRVVDDHNDTYSDN